MPVDTDTEDEGLATVGPNEADLDEYQSIALENGEVILYSEHEEGAWIQSDDYVDPSLML